MKNLHLTYFKLLMKKKLNLFLINLTKILEFQRIFYRILSLWTKELLLILHLTKKQELPLLTDQKLNTLKLIHLQTKNN